MKRVDYDAVAADFDRRYERNQYEGVVTALSEFLGDEKPATLEVGCGTGHWLAQFESYARVMAGVDLSWAMLDRARVTAPRSLLARATAERLPFADGSFDRVFCVNALHHFFDAVAFLEECHRVLRRGGAFMSFGLDPNTGVDQWWVYDYFPASLVADRQRYLPTKRIRELLEAAGFVDARTWIAQHYPAERSFEQAEQTGVLDRRHTSQLMVISDEDFEAGMRRIREERPVLRADLRFYATAARLEA